MSQNVELTRESLERAHEATEAHGNHENAAEQHRDMRRVAVMISVLAAGLALAEMGEKASQNEYLTHHIAVSDDYAYYQARTIRQNLYANQADVLESLPNAATDPAIEKKAAAARAQVKRMDEGPEGRSAMLDKAKAQTEERDHAFHLYHQYEMVVGALQIAIVLASVSVVTRIRTLSVAAAVLGIGAMGYGLLVVSHVI